MDDSVVRADLQALARARVLLGHQSVGRNVLAGVQALATESGVPLRILRIDGVPPDDRPGLFHSTIGKNGDPAGKCQAFAQLLARPERPSYDLAAMKFCYVDLTQGGPVNAADLLQQYASLVQQVRATRPDIRLMHITQPLRSDPPGLKTKLKRWLRRPTDEDADNVLRNAFNDGLRQRFAGEPLFDLAKVESTRSDGTRSSFVDHGRVVYTLAAQYTTDGGHLNPQAQRRVAAEFLHTLAASLRQEPAPATE